MSSLFCCSCITACLHPLRRHEDDGAQQQKTTRGATTTRSTTKRESVYHSALQDGGLSADELAALKELEDQVGADEDDSFFFFDAEQGSDNDNISFSAPMKIPYAPATTRNVHPRASVVLEQPSTLLLASGDKKKQQGRSVLNSVILHQRLREPRVAVALRGYPGELTQTELEACLDLRRQLKAAKKDKAYQQMVRAFETVEEEPYALCRFLRARHFDVPAVMTMMESAAAVWNEGQRHDFYPDISQAIGAPIALVRTQYPFLYHGIAKNGCPVSYFKAGQVSVKGLECLINLDDILYTAWNGMMHVFPAQLAKAQAIDPDVVRCEAMALFDLKGLSASTLNSRTLAILKRVIEVNVCFPEVLNSMVIVNAPGFFTFSWMIIKKLLDARTASKISIFSNETTSNRWLLENIEKGQLLSDYGGEGPSFDAALLQEEAGGDDEATNNGLQIVELLSLNPGTEKAVDFTLGQGDKLNVQIYTRSTSCSSVSLFQRTGAGDSSLVKEVKLRRNTSTEQQHQPDNGNNAEPTPFCTDIVSTVDGPGTFRLHVQRDDRTNSHQQQMDHFLVAGRVTTNAS